MNPQNSNVLPPSSSFDVATMPSRAEICLAAQATTSAEQDELLAFVNAEVEEYRRYFMHEVEKAAAAANLPITASASAFDPEGWISMTNPTALPVVVAATLANAGGHLLLKVTEGYKKHCVQTEVPLLALDCAKRFGRAKGWLPPDAQDALFANGSVSLAPRDNRGIDTAVRHTIGTFRNVWAEMYEEFQKASRETCGVPTEERIDPFLSSMNSSPVMSHSPAPVLNASNSRSLDQLEEQLANWSTTYDGLSRTSAMAEDAMSIAATAYADKKSSDVEKAELALALAMQAVASAREALAMANVGQAMIYRGAHAALASKNENEGGHKLSAFFKAAAQRLELASEKAHETAKKVAALPAILPVASLKTLAERVTLEVSNTSVRLTATADALRQAPQRLVSAASEMKRSLGAVTLGFMRRARLTVEAVRNDVVNGASQVRSAVDHVGQAVETKITDTANAVAAAAYTAADITRFTAQALRKQVEAIPSAGKEIFEQNLETQRSRRHRP